MTPVSSFIMEWKALNAKAKAEGWKPDHAMKIYAVVVARYLGAKDIRARSRVMDVFSASGGAATGLAVISLLRENVKSPKTFQWLGARAKTYAGEIAPSPHQGALIPEDEPRRSMDP